MRSRIAWKSLGEEKEIQFVRREVKVHTHTSHPVSSSPPLSKGAYECTVYASTHPPCLHVKGTCTGSSLGAL